MLAKYLRGLRDLSESGELLTGEVATQCVEAVDAFTAAADRLVAATDLAPFDAVSRAATEQAASRRSFQPRRLEGKQQVPCPEFADYCEAMATLAEIKGRNIERERATFAAVTTAAQEKRAEALAARDDIQGAPFREYRASWQQARFRLKAATDDARGVRRRRGGTG